jgi:hypothetical protein
LSENEKINPMDFLTRPWFKAHADDEGIDKIVLEVLPRYKQSYLSGDEWRTSISVTFYRKGQVVSEDSASRMKYAVMMLGHMFISQPEKSKTALWGLDEKMCHQYGCAEPAVVVLKIKEEYSAQGEGPIPSSSSEKRRAFCHKHSTRGDCGLEDADINYEVVS